MENPVLKKGDRGILVKSTQGHSARNGTAFEVKASRQNGDRLEVKFDGFNGLCNLYLHHDTYINETREAQIKNAKRQVKETSELLKKQEEELDYLENYASDEEYTAEKLSEILANPTKDSIQKVLETMRKSSYL